LTSKSGVRTAIPTSEVRLCKWQGLFPLAWKTEFPRQWKIEIPHTIADYVGFLPPSFNLFFEFIL
ncbi:MAG: hypothetical protein JXB00_00055, partial [Bacteroidales bacterium]|nr:hypothetical protein [Bacteroidales bacterium]